MSSAIKPTPGEWFSCFGGVMSRLESGFNVPVAMEICGSGAFVSGSPGETKARRNANLGLLVEAGNVFNETGLTPRQLVERDRALRTALAWAIKQMPKPIWPGEYANNHAKALALSAHLPPDLPSPISSGFSIAP